VTDRITVGLEPAGVNDRGLPTYRVTASFPDALAHEAEADLANRLRRLEVTGQKPEAVALREDIMPGRTTFGPYPLVRLAMSSHLMWGVIA
jgi:hypothetical protein